MSSDLSILGRLRHAALAFFKHDLVLQRDEAGARRIRLQDRTRPVVCVPNRAELAAKKEQAQLDAARRELAELLDREASLRMTLRHLAFVEQALQKKGWRGLYKVPLELLEKALQQLEALVTNWSAEGLACLRSKMAVTLIDREHQDEDEASAYKTAAVLDAPPAIAAQAIDAARARAIASEEPALPEPDADEAAALQAAYAALGVSMPAELGGVELQGELGSPSAKALARAVARA
jgi:hypothetical protein